MVNKHYYGVLLSNFKEALEKQESGEKYSLCAGDQWWWKAMKRDNWFGTMPSIFIQDNTISSISGQMYRARDHYR